MDDLFVDIVLIFILILVNGYFSGTEIAVVTARKSHIKRLAGNWKKECENIFETQERFRPWCNWIDIRGRGTGF